MKRWVFLFVILAALACIVPLSSKRPDAVQHVLGLSGGVDSALKAIGGILVAAATMMMLLFGLRRLGARR